MSDIHQQPPHPRVGQGWWDEFLRMVADWPDDILEEAIQEITSFLDRHPEVHLVGNDEVDSHHPESLG